jgi:hypothetical protein
MRLQVCGWKHSLSKATSALWGCGAHLCRWILTLRKRAGLSAFWLASGRGRISWTASLRVRFAL